MYPSSPVTPATGCSSSRYYNMIHATSSPKHQVTATGTTYSTMEIGCCLHYADIQRFSHLTGAKNMYRCRKSLCCFHVFLCQFADYFVRLHGLQLTSVCIYVVVFSLLSFMLSRSQDILKIHYCLHSILLLTCLFP